MKLSKFNFFIAAVLFAITFLFIQPLRAQQLKLSQGIAITHFIYQNEQGQMLNGLKSGSGLFLQLAYHKSSLVDTTKQKLEQTPFAIYLSQNAKVAKLLSLLNYDLGLQFSQLNAVGDIQNNAFSYQTDYLGIHGKFGIRIPLPWKVAINLQGIASINKIVHGNQLLSNRYVDLTENPQFGQVKLIGGYGAEVEKRFLDKLAGFVSYQQTQTLNDQPEGQSTLNFKPTVFSVGIRLMN
ncbi:hypothetical protein [Aquirufa sp. 5-AUSEE-100C1]